MKIIIETIKHSLQDYETVGNYKYLEDGTLYITVSDLGDERLERLVCIHELIEETLCKWTGIPNEKITEFDVEFEKNRKDGNVDEPGFDSGSPYKLQHYFATSVELGMCAIAGIDFKEYEEKINSL